MTVDELVTGIEGRSDDVEIRFGNLLFALTLDLQVAMRGMYDEKLMFVHRHVCAHFGGSTSESETIDGSQIDSTCIKTLLAVLNRLVHLCTTHKDPKYLLIYPVLKSVHRSITKFCIEHFMHDNDVDKRDRIHTFFANFARTEFDSFSNEVDRWMYDMMEAGKIPEDYIKIMPDDLKGVTLDVYKYLKRVGQRRTHAEIRKDICRSSQKVTNALHALINKYGLVIRLKQGGYVLKPPESP